FAFLALLACKTGPQPTPPEGPPESPSGSGPQARVGETRRAPQAPIPIEEYMQIRRLNGISFSHDEKLDAFTSDQSGRPDVWVKPLNGGEAVQVSLVRGRLHSYAFSPTADQLLYEADVGGDELPHLFLTNSKGDAPKDLVSDYPAGRRTEFVEWAEDGKSFLFLSNLRDEQYLDLYEYNVARGQAQRLWESSGKISFGLPSRDHRRLILVETVSDVDSNLYLLDRGKKEPVLLTKHSGEVLYQPFAISRDAKTLYLSSDQDREFTALYAMDL